MIHAFDQFVLDTDRAELCGHDELIAVEPKAFALLCMLIENRDRVVTKDELTQTLWQGRFISDAALSTLVKLARKAIDDDGTHQRLIRTVWNRGFRFVGDIRPSSPVPATARSGPAENGDLSGPNEANEGTRPKLAIMPFGQVGHAEGFSAIADAIPAELISSLSRLRWLQVVARESSFRIRAADVDLQIVRDSLGAGYCLSGIVEIFGRTVGITVELADTRTGNVVWADRITSSLDGLQQTRAEIVAAVIAALELQIPMNEAALARMRPTESLDAWSVFHVGLQHMYRFTRQDNAEAAHYFERATRLDPTFASAFAALSFTSFQTALMSYTSDFSQAVDDTRRHAERAVELDPLNPFANFSRGRMHFLTGDTDDGLIWLDRSVQLCPNYAKGYYSRGYADMLAGRAAGCHGNMLRSGALSPLDPLLCAMQSCNAVAYLQEGNIPEGARLAVMAARAPQAHVIIQMTAIAATWLAGDRDAARHWVKVTLGARPDATAAQYYQALPFADAGFSRLIGATLMEAGLPEG